MKHGKLTRARAVDVRNLANELRKYLDRLNTEQNEGRQGLPLSVCRWRASRQCDAPKRGVVADHHCEWYVDQFLLKRAGLDSTASTQHAEMVHCRFRGDETPRSTPVEVHGHIEKQFSAARLRYNIVYKGVRCVTTEN